MAAEEKNGEGCYAGGGSNGVEAPQSSHQKEEVAGARRRRSNTSSTNPPPVSEPGQQAGEGNDGVNRNNSPVIRRLRGGEQGQGGGGLSSSSSSSWLREREVMSRVSEAVHKLYSRRLQETFQAIRKLQQLRQKHEEEAEGLEEGLRAVRPPFELALMKEADHYEKLRRELEEKHHIAHQRILESQEKLRSQAMSKQCRLKDWLGEVDALLQSLEASTGQTTKSAFIESWPALMDRVSQLAQTSHTLDLDDTPSNPVDLTTRAKKAVSEALSQGVSLSGLSLAYRSEVVDKAMQAIPPPSSPPPPPLSRGTSDVVLERLEGLSLDNEYILSSSHRPSHHHHHHPHYPPCTCFTMENNTTTGRSSPPAKKKKRCREGASSTTINHHEGRSMTAATIPSNHSKSRGPTVASHRDKKKDDIIRELLQSYEELEGMYRMVVLEKEVALSQVQQYQQDQRLLCHSTTNGPPSSSLRSSTRYRSSQPIQPPPPPSSDKLAPTTSVRRLSQSAPIAHPSTSRLKHKHHRRLTTTRRSPSPSSGIFSDFSESSSTTTSNSSSSGGIEGKRSKSSSIPTTTKGGSSLSTSSTAIPSPKASNDGLTELLHKLEYVEQLLQDSKEPPSKSPPLPSLTSSFPAPPILPQVQPPQIKGM